MRSRWPSRETPLLRRVIAWARSPSIDAVSACARIPTSSGSWRALAPPPGKTTAPQAKPALFRVRYDGSVNEPLGMAVVRALTDAYAEFSRRLGGSPDEPITVVLQTEARFQGGRAPHLGGRDQRRDDPRCRSGSRAPDAALGAGAAPRAGALLHRRTHGRQLPDLAPGGNRPVARGGRRESRRREPGGGCARAGCCPPADPGGPVPGSLGARRHPGLRGEPLGRGLYRRREAGRPGSCGCCPPSGIGCPPKRLCPWPWRSAIRSSRRAGPIPQGRGSQARRQLNVG